MNNFYTVLVIPEKTKQVRKLVVPAIYVRVGLLLGAVAAFFLAFMVYDYVNVMRQLSENKRLQTENRQLKQQMQAFTTKLQNVQDALERIQSYTTKLRIITNQAGDNTENLKKRVAPDIQGVPMDDHSDLPPAKNIPSGREGSVRPELLPSTLRLLFPATLLAEDATSAEVAVETTQPAVPDASAPVAPEASQAVAPTVAPAVRRKRTRPAAPKAAQPVAPKVTQPVTPSAARPSTPSAARLGTATVTDSNIPSSDAAKIVEDAEKAKDSAAPVAPSAPRRLSDLIREDEERESAELRRDFSKLNQAFGSVLQHALSVELDVQSLTTALLDQRDYLDSMPTLKPTNGWYTSGFGLRNSPFTNKSTMHEGLDLANHVGSTIVAPASGIVTYAGARAGYGNLVTLDHGYGIQTQFGHISRSYVKTGEKVKRGQRIAAVGNTGRSTGPHVHYEVRVNGIPVDPYFYILED